MPGLKFSVPYNQKLETLKKLAEIKELNGNEIKEVYLSGPQKHFGSARVTNKFTESDLLEVIDFCHSNDLEVNLLLNSSCEGLDWYKPERVSEILNFVKKMEENGLDSITVANPLYLRKIRKEIPEIKITGSVIAEVGSAQRATFFEEFGADVLTPDRDANRNLEILKNIKEATEMDLKLLVDECCLYRCPFRKFHDNYTSHYSKESYEERKDPFTVCRKIEEIDPSQLLKSPWIRPEDARKYKEITDWFKIEGRTATTEKIIKKVKAYLKEDSEIHPNPFFHKIPEGFFERVTSCDKNCYKCDYCEELAEEIF